MYSWLHLAAVVIAEHVVGALLALLSANVISELGSTEEQQEQGREVERCESHNQYPIHLQSSTASSALSPRSA